MRAMFLVVLLLLAGCASAPTQTANACSIFAQKDGLFNNWYKAAKRSEREFGVPVPVLMATIRAESSFRAHARPPRTKLLGFIPWKRISTAYGFSQALDGTWKEYKRSTGRTGADRNDFADAVHFVGWYHHRSHEKNGIALNDAYHLYLAYYYGHAGYARGKWRGSSAILGAAKRTASTASTYAAQMRSCGL